jgi:hypothetical protein
MRMLVIALLAFFGAAVLTRVRPSLAIVFCVLLIAFAVSGCATVEKSTPAPAQGDLCSHDGSYLFLPCKRSI